MKLNFTPLGVLTETPFVELAGAINRQRLTGSLHLSAGLAERRAERIVYFSHGEVYAAASNLAPDSAIALLLRAGRVSQNIALRIQQEVTAGRAFSEALVAYGCVTREELNHLRIEHVKSIFNSLCEWTSGEFRFTEGSQVSGGRLGVSAKALLIEGALFSPVPSRFREWIADPCTWVSAAQPTTPDVSLLPFAHFLLSCLDQPRNLVILAESGRLDESEQDILQQLYGLYCAGFVEFIKAAKPAENPLRPQAETQVIAAKKATETTPVCMALAWPAQEDPETAKRRRLERIKRDIKQIRQLLSSANDDYAVLGLRPGATPADVKHAYRQLVNHYHPDRHHPHADPITLATLSDVLMAIRTSYETAIEHALLSEIISSNKRRYQAVKRAQTESSSVPADPHTPQNTGQNLAEQMQSEKLTAEAIKSRNLSLAEVKHRQALSYQARGEYESAIGFMTDAVTLAPDCARYHGELAALLEKVPVRREQAEQHFLRATELEPSNLFYHLQLGSFYRAVGLLSRAEQQFILALKIDPVDRAAASALEEVMSLKKTQAASAHYGRKRVSQRQGFWARFFNRNGHG
jgi:tetratricopeptide (TPR) repeat protein